MSWKLVYLPEAAEDYKNLTRRQQLVIDKAINKVKFRKMRAAMANRLAINAELILLVI